MIGHISPEHISFDLQQKRDSSKILNFMWSIPFVASVTKTYKISSHNENTIMNTFIKRWLVSASVQLAQSLVE